MTLIEALKLSRSVYRPINNCRLEFDRTCDEATFLCRICLNDLLAEDWEPIIEKKTKLVWEWMARSSVSDSWIVEGELKTEDEAKHYYGKSEYRKLRGPFEVEI